MNRGKAGKASDPIDLIDSDDESLVGRPTVAQGGYVTGIQNKRSTGPHGSAELLPANKKVRQNDQHDERAANQSCGSSSKTNGIPPCELEGEYGTSPIKLFATEDDVRRRKVTPCQDRWSFTECWTLREMLGLDRQPTSDPISWIVISTFVIDFNFLLNEIPELLSIPRVVVIYGSKDNSDETWRACSTSTNAVDGSTSCSVDFVCRDPGAPKLSAMNPLKHQMHWGCHHTKMFMVGYASKRTRVIVHTANMRYEDVNLKTQGAFLQDFWPKPSSASRESSEFENSLLMYLSSYKYDKSLIWNVGEDPCTLLELLSTYDFSTAKGVLIPSIPGYHKVPTKKDAMYSALGYLKLKHAIQQYSSQQQNSSKQSIVCQFSSIGSLSEKYLRELQASWNPPNIVNEDVTTNKAGNMKDTRVVPLRLELVYPTKNEIALSVEGRAGGGSVPGRQKNTSKPFLQPLLRKWSSPKDHLCRSWHVPHIKTYYQRNDSDDDGKATLSWFCLGSQNLSKAAWGEVQNNKWGGQSFKVMHWELGIMISASLLGVRRLVPYVPRSDGTATHYNGKQDLGIPLPYCITPEKYDADDTPWTID